MIYMGSIVKKVIFLGLVEVIGTSCIIIDGYSGGIYYLSAIDNA